MEYLFLPLAASGSWSLRLGEKGLREGDMII
jgi:hypothetical protein